MTSRITASMTSPTASPTAIHPAAASPVVRVSQIPALGGRAGPCAPGAAKRMAMRHTKETEAVGKDSAGGPAGIRRRVSVLHRPWGTAEPSSDSQKACKQERALPVWMLHCSRFLDFPSPRRFTFPGIYRALRLLWILCVRRRLTSSARAPLTVAPRCAVLPDPVACEATHALHAPVMVEPPGPKRCPAPQARPRGARLLCQGKRCYRVRTRVYSRGHTRPICPSVSWICVDSTRIPQPRLPSTTAPPARGAVG
jgi:hypothetical protein